MCKSKMVFLRKNSDERVRGRGGHQVQLCRIVKHATTCQHCQIFSYLKNKIPHLLLFQYQKMFSSLSVFHFPSAISRQNIRNRGESASSTCKVTKYKYVAMQQLSTQPQLSVSSVRVSGPVAINLSRKQTHFKFKQVVRVGLTKLGSRHLSVTML